jgi:hypothetical protein
LGEKLMLKRTRLVVILSALIIAAFLIALPANAANWQKKVTGGGRFPAGYLSISAVEKDGVTKGQYEVEYWDATEKEHGIVHCIWIAPDESRAVVGGTSTINQKGEWEPAYILFFIIEAGTGSGDLTNGWFASEKPDCHAYEGDARWDDLDPAIDGNFNLRLR